MKRKIIKNLEENQTEVQLKDFKATSNLFYGVEFPMNGQRGFIRREKNEAFTVVSPKNLTGGNGWTHWNSATLDTTIEELVIKYGCNVYEFDTFIALMGWVSEGK